MLNRKYKNISDREKVIKKIRDIMYGDAFQYYKEKFYLQTGSDTMNDEQKRKLYDNSQMLSKVINIFTSFCPDLALEEIKGKNSKKKRELLNQCLNVINWDTIIKEIYVGMETEGDVFYYIYFDKEEKNKPNKAFNIPKIKRLDALKVKNILLNEDGTSRAYFYKDTVCTEEINYSTGEITESDEKEVTYIFEKGICHRIIDSTSSKGTLVSDKQGNMVISGGKNSIYNMEGLDEYIPLIHIHSDKQQGEKFSVIPADFYAPICLKIDQIDSDIRAINRNMGFPRTILLDCIFTEGDGRIGGVRIARSTTSADDVENNYQGKIIDMQIKNGLDSSFEERRIVVDNLYDIVGITNPSLMQRVGSSDSSKMYNQVNKRMEQKISKYINNIISAFKVYFKFALIANKLYDEKNDFDLSFKKPESIINTSVYDDLLIKQLKLNTGLSTIRSLLKEQGYTDEQIDEHYKQLNTEIMNGKQDISVSEEIKNNTPIENKEEEVIES